MKTNIIVTGIISIQIAYKLYFVKIFFNINDLKSIMKSHFRLIKMKCYQKRIAKVARDALNLAQLLPNEQMELTYFRFRLKVIIFCLETQWAESMMPIRKRTNLFDVSDKNTTHMIPIVNERTSLFLKFYVCHVPLFGCARHIRKIFHCALIMGISI